MKIIYLILRSAIVISSVLAMFFISHFTIASKEDWDIAIETKFWEIFFSRFLITLLIGMLFFLIGLIVNRIFKNKIKFQKIRLNKYMYFELLGVFLISIIFVLIVVMK